jgi:integrase
VRPACRKLRIVVSGSHDCRHTAVTRLLNNGVSTKTVARIAGQSDVRITLNTYTHVETEQLNPLLRLSCALLVTSEAGAA